MHKNINVYCRENVLWSTGRQMSLGNLDDRHVFRMTINNHKCHVSGINEQIWQALLCSHVKV